MITGMTHRFVGPLCLTGEGQLVRVTPHNKSLQLTALSRIHLDECIVFVVCIVQIHPLFEPGGS